VPALKKNHNIIKSPNQEQTEICIKEKQAEHSANCIINEGQQVEFPCSLKTHLSLLENFTKLKSELHKGLPLKKMKSCETIFIRLKVPKCEIFHLFDFNDVYGIKSL
jgi:hypothetical protein